MGANLGDRWVSDSTLRPRDFGVGPSADRGQDRRLRGRPFVRDHPRSPIRSVWVDDRPRPRRASRSRCLLSIVGAAVGLQDEAVADDEVHHSHTRYSHLAEHRQPKSVEPQSADERFQSAVRIRHVPRPRATWPAPKRLVAVLLALLRGQLALSQRRPPGRRRTISGPLHAHSWARQCMIPTLESVRASRSGCRGGRHSSRVSPVSGCIATRPR